MTIFVIVLFLSDKGWNLIIIIFIFIVIRIIILDLIYKLFFFASFPKDIAVMRKS
jgi:hypothetical protein